MVPPPVISWTVPTTLSYDPRELPPLSEFLPLINLPYLTAATDAVVLAPTASVVADVATSATTFATDTAAAAAALVSPTLLAFGHVFVVLHVTNTSQIYFYLSCANYSCSFCSSYKAKENWLFCYASSYARGTLSIWLSWIPPLPNVCKSIWIIWYLSSFPMISVCSPELVHPERQDLGLWVCISQGSLDVWSLHFNFPFKFKHLRNHLWFKTILFASHTCQI